MNKIYKYLIYTIIFIHLIGFGISSYFFSWEFQNKNNVVKSYFISDLIGNIKGFFWEYYLIKKYFNNKELTENEVNRLRFILQTAMQNEDADLDMLKNEFWKILSKKYGNDKNSAKNEFIGYLDKDYLKYGKEFWITTLFSYETNNIYISNEVKKLESRLLKKGAITEERIKLNHQLLYDIVNRNKIIYNGSEVIFTKEMIEASIKNSDGAIKRFLYIIN